MSRETSLDVAAELEALLPEGSKALSLLSGLQQALRLQESEGSDYTRSRAAALQQLAQRMKILVSKSREDEMTYADRAKALSVIADAYLKLVHAFKTDPKMWSLAQTELVPTLTQVSDEESIDVALTTLESHLETYLNSLDSWLEKSP